MTHVESLRQLSFCLSRRLAPGPGCAPILLKFIRKLDGTKKSGRGSSGLNKCGRKQGLEMMRAKLKGFLRGMTQRKDRKKSAQTLYTWYQRASDESLYKSYYVIMWLRCILNSEITFGNRKFWSLFLETTPIIWFLLRSINADGTPEVTCEHQSAAGAAVACGLARLSAASPTICERVKIL